MKNLFLILAVGFVSSHASAQYMTTIVCNKILEVGKADQGLSLDLQIDMDRRKSVLVSERGFRGYQPIARIPVPSRPTISKNLMVYKGVGPSGRIQLVMEVDQKNLLTGEGKVVLNLPEYLSPIKAKLHCFYT